MRLTVVVVVLAVVVAACGDSSPPLAETSTDRLELAVVVEPQPLVSGQPATLHLEVTNVSDERGLLTFDTTQRGDVALSTGGVEVYRWSEGRAFAQVRDEVAFVPGQRVRFPLDIDELPVGPGEYEMLATVTGLPKLRTVRGSVSVVDVAPTGTPSPEETAEPTAGPSLPVAYEQLTTAVDTTVDDLAVPLASALTGDTFDTEGAVLRQEVTDALARLTFAELLLAYAVATGGDAGAVRPLAAAAAGRAAETFGGLRSVEPVDRRAVDRLLGEHVAAVDDYAAVVGAGGDDEALEAPRAELEQITAELGPLVAVTAGGVIDTDDATTLFRTWTDRLVEAIRVGARTGATVEEAHRAASVAVEPLGLDVAQAYAEFLDLAGFESTPAVVRQELSSQLVDEALLLAVAVDVGQLDRARAIAVLDENADELAAAVGRAPAIDAAEESAFLELWQARDDALADVAASPDGDVPEALVEADAELAQLLADAAAGTLAADEVRAWLETQREALIDALSGLATTG